MIPGIDVSVYQGLVIWHKVKEAGYEWAGIKATEALNFHDPRFPRNWTHSKEHSLQRIAYHFFHGDISGQRQADFFHAAVHDAGGFGVGDCAMVDLEETNGQDTGTIIANLEAFIERFLSTTQCGLYLYTNHWFWDGILGGPKSAIIGKCPLWAASYGAFPASVSNWPHGPSIWQWTETLQVNGIVGNVDGDRFLGTMQEYLTLARKGGRS